MGFLMASDRVLIHFLINPIEWLCQARENLEMAHAFHLFFMENLDTVHEMRAMSRQKHANPIGVGKSRNVLYEAVLGV